MICCVCFDMDGVLFDTETLGGRMMGEAAKAQQCALTEAQWKSLIGTTMAMTSERLHQWYPMVDMERLMRDWLDLTLCYVRKHGMPKKDGAEETLHLFKECGLHLALCSSNTPEVIHEYLRLAGWTEIFDAVVTLDKVQQPKPAPDMYLYAAHILGCKPEDCIGVEDSYSGIRSVRAAGMTSVMVPDVIPYDEATMRPYVDHLLTTLRELPPFVFGTNSMEG